MRGGWAVVLMVGLGCTGCQTTPTITPEQERAWQEKQERNKVEMAAKREADAKAAAEAAAKEAELCQNDGAVRSWADAMRCGDRFKKENNTQRAIARWHEAATKAATKKEVCPPTWRILAVSVHPEEDLSGVSPAVIAECKQVDEIIRDCRPACRRESDACYARAGGNTGATVACAIKADECVGQCAEIEKARSRL